LFYKEPHNVRLRLADEKHVNQLDSDETTTYEIRIPYSFMQRLAKYMKVNYEGRSIWDDVTKRGTIK